ncbi:hypothetical protein AX17_000189 [Amanita inopinata Kibby_2008]|nr:hypothetical protein AX17_000189 [Amanita inopinata Kibby_2008]
MSSSKPLGLPPITPELRVITPFLQRADEVKHQEPIIAYWCAYYAAQQGISLRVKDAASREVLSTLLGVLEQLKKDIGTNDAIDVESASCAYVENFALRVFAVADNEDRKGCSTRTTAKKFLASANFLEVLNVFPAADVSESNDEKIRYAKWKAADIAKAFREGRKPVPGPAVHLISEAPPVSEGVPEILSNPDNPVETHSSEDHDAHSVHAPLDTRLITDEAIVSGPHTRNAWISDESEGQSIPMSTSSPRLSQLESGVSQSPDNAGIAKDTVITEQVSLDNATDAHNQTLLDHHVASFQQPLSPPPSVPPFLSSAHFGRGQDLTASPAPVQELVTDSSTIELTPSVIVNVQRLCRFAISALDYEDVEQAKKELRAALAILDGQ